MYELLTVYVYLSIDVFYDYNITINCLDYYKYV